MTPNHIYVAGYPKAIGGANTEIWHTVRLFRDRGLGVTMLPTWEWTDEWRHKLDSIGAMTVSDYGPGEWGNVPSDLPGSIILMFSNTFLIDEAQRFRDMDCKIISVPCMNWLYPQEKVVYRTTRRVFDRYVFQSHQQRDKVIPQLSKHGYHEDQGRVIRGAFDPSLFPHAPKPHKPPERFIIGRLSRPGVDKFPGDLWRQVSRIPYPTTIRVMGWDEKVLEVCGHAPEFAEVLPVQAETAQAFLGSIHALVPGMGCCGENWPRVGLEAMAAGVPIVAEKKAGWAEMLGESGGVLCESIHQQAYEVARLAWDSQHRMGVIVDGRVRMEELADPDVIWDQWKTLFEELT